MRLIITDTGRIWNHENPILKEYKDAVLVVCLNGKKVTEEYECFISPYERSGVEPETYGQADPCLRTLTSVGKDLNGSLRYHDDIVFFVDDEPSTLYPFYVIKDLNAFNRLHLVVVPPLNVEPEAATDAFRELLSDLSRLDSFFYYDKNTILNDREEAKDAHGFPDQVRVDVEKRVPHILNGIYHMKVKPCFYDFASERYIPLRDGFESIDISGRDHIDNEIDFWMYRSLATLGLTISVPYPEEGERVKKGDIERPVPRVDGKKVCDVLREQRMKLAAANMIPFASEECPSIGACAGTCEKCDREADYLREQMELIPEEKRVYPHFDPVGEVAL